MNSKFLADFYMQLNPDNTMTFNRLLAHSVGATETIILYTLISKYYYYERNSMLDEEGWFYVTIPDLHESSSFGEKIQRNAIKHLENLGFIQTALKGVPAKRYFKINNDLNLLQEYLEKGDEIANNIKNAENGSKKSEKNTENSFKKSEKNEKISEKHPANDVNAQILPKGRSRSAQTAELDPPKRQNLIRPNGGTRSAQKADLSKSKSNKSKYNKSINQDLDNININNNINTYRCEEMDSIDKIDKQEIAEKIKKQVNYPKLTEEYEQDKSMIDSIVGILADTEASCAETIRIAKEDKPLAEIKARFAQLTNEHIAYVLECISAQSRKPRNIKSYLLTVLYNAPATMGAYFTAKARERPPEITDSDLIDYKSLVNNFL